MTDKLLNYKLYDGIEDCNCAEKHVYLIPLSLVSQFKVHVDSIMHSNIFNGDIHLCCLSSQGFLLTVIGLDKHCYEPLRLQLIFPMTSNTLESIMVALFACPQPINII